MRSLLAISIFIIIASCRKPRDGDYIKIENSVTTYTSCSTPTSPCNDTTTSETQTQDVTIENIRKNSVLINDELWNKKDKSITYHSVYSSHYSPGSGGGYTVTYNGTIINKHLIQGTFTVDGLNGSPMGITKKHKEGNFTIKKK